jgi:predicted DNA-binding transcriptional regulator YafY
MQIIVGPSARLLRLLSLLQTPRDWTGAELAERLEVSTRTVRQDIERLRSLGYPVHANRGAIGGYRLEAGANLPPLLLEDDEAVAVAVGLRTAAGGAVTGIEETSLRALAKVEQVLPARLRNKVNALQTATVLVTGRPGPTVDAEVLTLLAATCRDHTSLRFDYEDRKGSASRRAVEPHRLVNAGRRWYLVAWDTDRSDWRTFRVDRLRPYLPLGGRFTPRPLSDEEVQALVARGVPPTARRYQARVLIHAPVATIAERIGPWVGTVEADGDDRCILETGADSLEVLAVHLGMLDADFSVTEPPELVGHLRSLADRYGRATAPSA